MDFTRIIRFPKSYSKSRFLNSFCQERFPQNMYLPKQPDCEKKIVCRWESIQLSYSGK